MEEDMSKVFDERGDLRFHVLNGFAKIATFSRIKYVQRNTCIYSPRSLLVEFTTAPTYTHNCPPLIIMHTSLYLTQLLHALLENNNQNH